MPIFILKVVGWLGSFITSIASFFALYLTKKVAVTLAAIAALLVLTTAFWLTIESILSGISVVFPADFNTALGWFVPGNIAECAGAWMSAKVLRFAYDMKARGIQMRSL